MPQVPLPQVINYAKQAGFSGQALVTIVSIAWAESGLNSTAINHNSNGTQDWGILQINSIHPITQAQAFNPAYAFQFAYNNISSRGTNFNPWTTYTNGAYKKYVSQVQMQIGDTSASSQVQSVAKGDGNNFPAGQCTWWADERYHQLTGYYVPWNHTGQANAYQWLARAKESGWNTSSTPPKGVPSIICLQGFTQGATSSLGHVAIVERVNSDGSVLTSNMNWHAGPPFSTNINTQGYPVTQVTFQQGNGVSFIWAGGGTATGGSNTGGGAGGATYTPLLEQVHQTLVEVPGFYGMALAMDEAEKFPGWIDLTDPSNSLDVIGWIRSVGATITDNFVPFMIRGVLVTLGVFILIALITKVVLEVGDTALPVVKAIGS